MSCSCACCSGANVATPVFQRNRPGLQVIAHHPGRHADFLTTMHTRLSSAMHPALAALKTRAPDDASIALCDAWAVAADVLAFYQDRIANEGYLRTATERRSLVELGRLTGYALRPGVAASVYLAYELDANAGSLAIPPGTRAQNVPEAGETMQTFETSELLLARAAWSRIKVRTSVPAWRSPNDEDPDYGVLKRGVTLDGTATRLKPNDALLVDYGERYPRPYRITTVTVDEASQTTHVAVAAWKAPPHAPEPVALQSASPKLAQIVERLQVPLKLQPRSPQHVPRDTRSTLKPGAEIYSRLLTRQSDALRDMLLPALRGYSAASAGPRPVRVFAPRARAALFGHAAPGKVLTDPAGPSFANLSAELAWRDLPGMDTPDGSHVARDLNHLPLDSLHEAIRPTQGTGSPSYVLIDGYDAAGDDRASARVFRVLENRSAAMSIGAAISARVSQLVTDESWFSLPDATRDGLRGFLRRAQVFADSEELQLARDAVRSPVTAGDEIELDGYYDGLEPGMWVIAAGRRADVTDDGLDIPAAERAMIAAVRHDVVRLSPQVSGADEPRPLPGDTLHTYVTLAQPLTYAYRRDDFVLYGNVVRATHGETRREPLGGGDATRTFQRFTLRSPPVTHVAAPTAAGVASTLEVRVNGLLWKEHSDIATATAQARIYTTVRDAEERTSVRFGDGHHGARLPSGADNLAATYRSGIGRGGNVGAGRITLPTDKPLGVTGVTNPIRATGGADADTLEQARVNAPLSVTALDRLVSVQDYADFARCFAGIGKATATLLNDGYRSVVHLSVAGIADAPLDDTSELLLNLRAALRACGDPNLPVCVQVREALSLLLAARVAIHPDVRWEDVQPRIHQALLGQFGFAASEIGAPVIFSRVLTTIETVPGVDHVFGLRVSALDEERLIAGLDPMQSAPDPSPRDKRETPPGWLDVAGASVVGIDQYRAAQLAYLAPGLVDNVIMELSP